MKIKTDKYKKILNLKKNSNFQNFNLLLIMVFLVEIQIYKIIYKYYLKHISI